MNVLILSSPDPYKNAGRVAMDAYNALLNAPDFRVAMVTRYCKSHDRNIRSIHSLAGYAFAAAFRRAQNLMNKKLGSGLKTKPEYHFQEPFQNNTRYSTKRILRKSRLKPDAILVLFMQNFLSYRNLSELQKQTGARLFLFPMDMAPYTGGCHYSWECEGYLKDCGSCPALSSTDPHDQSYKNLQFKRRFVAKMNVTLVAGNKQMLQQITASSLFRDKKIVDKFYPLPDLSVFRKRDRREAKRYFGIELKKTVLFFGAVTLNDKRKGMSVLFDALKEVHQQLQEEGGNTENIVLLVAGTLPPQHLLPFETIYLGHVSELNKLANAYSAGEYFICPSLEDAGPTMVLQSVCCETPVISFDIGFSREFISDGINGFKSTDKSVESLAFAIRRALNIKGSHYTTIENAISKTAAEIRSVSFGERLIQLLKGDGK
jgi:glycosyltransferase involved in cell wall biosynthesis